MRHGYEEENSSKQLFFAEILFVATAVLFVVAMTPLGEMTLPEIWQVVKGWGK